MFTLRVIKKSHKIESYRLFTLHPYNLFPSRIVFAKFQTHGNMYYVGSSVFVAGRCQEIVDIVSKTLNDVRVCYGDYISSSRYLNNTPGMNLDLAVEQAVSAYMAVEPPAVVTETRLTVY